MPPDMYRVPLTLDPQPEGGYSVTSPQLPELLTEGDTVDEALANAQDAFAAVLEIYQEEGRPLPPGIQRATQDGRIETELLGDRNTTGNLCCI